MKLRVKVDSTRVNCPQCTLDTGNGYYGCMLPLSHTLSVLSVGRRKGSVHFIRIPTRQWVHPVSTREREGKRKERISPKMVGGTERVS